MPRAACAGAAFGALPPLSVLATVVRPDGGDAVETLDGASLFQVKGCATAISGP